MPDRNTVSVENIIYGSFVKMAVLKDLTINTFGGTSIADATELNIFIDLYSVLKSIFSEHYRTDIQDYTAITSGIINMCSHYRSFYRTLSVNTRFFLIATLNTCDINRKFVAEYNKKFLKKSEIEMFQKVVMDNFDLLELICPYLPDIHFIRSPRNYEASVIIAYLIGDVIRSRTPNLIISKDFYPLQLCSEYPYTALLYPIKKFGQDGSVMIPIYDKRTYRFEFWKLFSSIRKLALEELLNIDPVNFPLLCALNRFPERDLSAILNIQSAISVIYNFAGSERIKINPEQFYTDSGLLSKIPIEKVISRYKTLDIDFMLPYYRNDPESRMIKLDNLKDPATLNMINSKFFAHNPLELNKL